MTCGDDRQCYPMAKPVTLSGAPDGILAHPVIMQKMPVSDLHGVPRVSAATE